MKTRKAANPERKELFANMARKIAAMSDTERDTLAAQMPVVTVTGHPLSPRNACMVAMQCSSATIVGGFKQWLAAGRCVKKGEHGMLILVPAQKKTETGEPQGDMFFIAGTVFDVSQTMELDPTKTKKDAAEEIRADFNSELKTESEPAPIHSGPVSRTFETEFIPL